jgi:regulatory protein
MSDVPARHPQYAEAKTAAVRLLAGRARTRADLERRLRSRELAAEAVTQALDDLARAGYVDDVAYARERIEQVLRDGKRGAAALIDRLIGDGLPAELAERVVAERLADEDARVWALEAARERLPRLRGLERETARRRLFGYLQRRGFDASEALGATDEVLPALDEDY